MKTHIQTSHRELKWHKTVFLIQSIENKGCISSHASSPSFHGYEMLIIPCGGW